jgi:hypothetical protein
MPIQIRSNMSSETVHDQTNASRSASDTNTSRSGSARSKAGAGMLNMLKQLGSSMRSSATPPRTARPGRPLAASSSAGSSSSATLQRQRSSRPVAQRGSVAKPALPTITESPYEAGPLASLGQHYDDLRLRLGKANAQAQGALTSPRLPLLASSKQTKAILTSKRDVLQQHADGLRRLLEESEQATVDRSTVTQLASHPDVSREQAALVRSDIDQTLLQRHRAQQALNKVEKWVADLDKQIGVSTPTLGELMHRAKPTRTTRAYMGLNHVSMHESVTVVDEKGRHGQAILHGDRDGNNAAEPPRALDPVRAAMSITKRELGINKMAEQLQTLVAGYPEDTFTPMLEKGQLPKAVLDKAGRYGVTPADHQAIIERAKEYAELDAEDQAQALAESESESESASEITQARSHR